MVNRRYENKKEVILEPENGTGSPLSDHFFLSTCSEINSLFNQKEKSQNRKLTSCP